METKPCDSSHSLVRPLCVAGVRERCQPPLRLWSVKTACRSSTSRRTSASRLGSLRRDRPHRPPSRLRRRPRYWRGKLGALGMHPGAARRGRRVSTGIQIRPNWSRHACPPELRRWRTLVPFFVRSLHRPTSVQSPPARGDGRVSAVLLGRTACEAARAICGPGACRETRGRAPAPRGCRATCAASWTRPQRRLPKCASGAHGRP